MSATDRRTHISLTVEGAPVVNEQIEVGERRYLVTHVSRDYYFRDGGWTGQRWKGRATIIKKDGTLGIAEKTLPWKWEPDAETQRQFAMTARRNVRIAQGVQEQIS